MRRREGNAKSMGPPMFPRLHVNDTTTGGPRAPPRNKMALYEQLTIHSQSCNSGSALTPTLNPNNNNIGSDPFTSRNQGINCERRMHLPMDQRSLPSSYSHDEFQGTAVVDLSNQSAPMEQQVKTAQKDDPVVPIFSQHRVGQCTVGIHNSGDGGRLLNSGNKKADHSVGDVIARQRGINQGRRTLRVSDAPKRYLEISKRKKDGVQRGQDKCSLSSSEETEVCLCQHLGNGLPAVETRFDEGGSDPPMESIRKDISLRLVDNSCIGYGSGDVNGIDHEMRMIDDCSLEMENVERADDMSETSILDSASALDISAEDVVGIIGVKNFLRARSAIVNQQRVLAAQVFELHRLMKVQGLIAGSLHLLHKDSAFMDKTSKDSNIKIYSPEFAAKAFAHTINKKDDPKDPNDKAQCTAENAVSKVPPVSAPKLSPPVNTDPEMNSWSFHQSASHQWLVPMMCPSQGLVYRPCPTPGFMSPVLGGYGPLGLTPAVGNLMNPAYDMPLGLHYGRQGYFHPYGMPIMSPSVSGLVMDQMTKFFQDDPHGQIGRPGGVSGKSSSNRPIQKDGTNMPGAKAGDLQRNTTISPSHQAQGPGAAHLTEGGDTLLVSPVSIVTGVSLGASSTEKGARVIRVVPRDRGSTRESAAFIFQSIQKERQQQGSS